MSDKLGDSFVPVLIAAVVILIALALISGYIGTWPSDNGGTTEGFLVLEEAEIGTIGFTDETAAKTINIGTFVAGEEQEEVLRSVLGFGLESSVFGVDKETYSVNIPSYYMDSLRKIVISFAVEDSNMYGNLVVNWNGKDFFKKKAHPSSYEIEVTEDYVQSENTLEVYAEGPGVMFWASNVYTIRNFEVKVLYGPAKIHPFELTTDDMQTFSKGEIRFYATGSKNLEIKLNGLKIYDDVPSGSETVRFDFSNNLNTGKNLLTFIADQGPVTLHDTAVDIYLLTNEIVKQIGFDMSESEYDTLESNKGRIDFYIDEVKTRGKVKIRLNGNILVNSVFDEGKSTVYYEHSDAKEGSNTVEFSSTGEVVISEMKIGIEQ